MRTAFRVLVVILLLAIEFYAVYLVLHPRVSPEYRAYYIEHTTRDWNPNRYQATPEDGIDFTKSGLPTFVRYTVGFSFPEARGRWTDATLSPSAQILLDRKISGPNCLEITAKPSYAERGKSVQVAWGHEVQTLVFSSDDYTAYRVSFANPVSTDTVGFRFPGKVPSPKELYPPSRDERRLGMSLLRLRILPGPCS
jgi:phosphoglycerol transferase